MATRLKTVQYAVTPITTTTTNNTLTNFAQITIYLPDSPISFKSVLVKFSADDIVSATGGSITTKTLGMRLGASAYTTVTSSSTLTNSGENISLHWTQDFSSLFSASWSGTSMTADLRFQINQSTGSTLGVVNACATIEITYEYDDTSTTQVKTVWIPLNAPVGAMPTTSTNYDTIPNLSTYLPEASKTFRSIFMVFQGNSQINGSTTSGTITLTCGTASQTTGTLTASLTTDRFTRFVWNLTSTYPSTSATQTVNMSSSQATRYHHPQAWLVVTYEYDESTSTSIMNSLMLPFAAVSPMGSASTIYQSYITSLSVQEPGTITLVSSAAYVFWTATAAITGLNMRLGASAFTTYTDNIGASTSAIAGICCAMIRDDTAFSTTFYRGIGPGNALNFDVYRTSTTNMGWGLSGFFIINYTSDKSTYGSGAHNHTVSYSIATDDTVLAVASKAVTQTGLTLPDTYYYINAFGVESKLMTASATAQLGGYSLVVANDSGSEYKEIYLDAVETDQEVGCYLFYSHKAYDVFKRSSGEYEFTILGDQKLDFATNRIWRFSIAGGATASPTTAFFAATAYITYHSIYNTTTFEIKNSGGAAGAYYVMQDLWGGNPTVTYISTFTGDGTYTLVCFDADSTTTYVLASVSASNIQAVSKQAAFSAGIPYDIDFAQETYYAYM